MAAKIDCIDDLSHFVLRASIKNILATTTVGTSRTAANLALQYDEFTLLCKAPARSA